MTHRDDLDAAQARATAAVAENEALRAKLARLSEGEARPLVPLPERFVVREHAGTLVVQLGRRRGFPTSSVVMLAYLMVMWLSYAGSRPGTLVLVLVCAQTLLLYPALCWALNRATVTLDERGILVTEGPIPVPGRVRVARADLAQLFVDERRGTKGDPPTYALHTLDHAGRKRTLLEDLNSADQVRWLEVEIERRLGIATRPVAGELPR